MEIIGFDDVQEYEKGGSRVNVRIYQGNYKLKEGVDYTLTYKKNDVVSTLDRYGEPNPDSYVIIKGIGNFSGTIEKKFAIKTKDISKCNMKALDIVSNFEDYDSFTTNVTITDTNGNVLKAGKDYNANFMYYYAHDTLVEHDGSTIVRKANEEVSRYDIVFPGTELRVVTKGIGNYEGSVEATYRVGELSLAKAIVTVRKQYYNGSAITVLKDDITVIVDGQELYPNEFEIVGYTNNTKKGNSATVTIRGRNGVVGEATAKFSIVTRPIDSYIIRFYGRDPEERYDMEYPYHFSNIKGTMDDLIIKSTKEEMKLPKCKYKYVIDDDGDIFEQNIYEWYCSELDTHVDDEETLYNEVMYYMNCNGGIIHLYANYFPNY